MISFIQPSTEEADDYPVPAVARRMALDWDSVAAAFDAVSTEFGWDANVRICPERRYVELVVPRDRTDHVGSTTLDFYRAVVDRIGIDEFMSIWVDFDVMR